MRYSKEQRREHVAAIRRITKKHEHLTLEEIRAEAQAQGYTFGRPYIKLLRNKVIAEREYRRKNPFPKHENLTRVTRQYLSLVDQLHNVLFPMMLNPETRPGAKIEAAGEARRNIREQYRLLMNSGLLIPRSSSDPTPGYRGAIIPPDMKARLSAIMKRYEGLSPAEVAKLDVIVDEANIPIYDRKAHQFFKEKFVRPEAKDPSVRRRTEGRDGP